MLNLSIIVPIYNVDKYLKNCIESILSQTFNDYELILVNDGSTDCSGEICNYYKSIDSRIKVIHQENRGVSSARNKGIHLAKGKYIAFVDPDDEIEATMYEKMIEKCLKNDLDIVVCKIKTYNQILNYTQESIIWKKDIGYLNKEKIQKKLIPAILTEGSYSMISSVNKVYKASIFKDNKLYFNEKMNHGEDARLNLLLIQNINSLEFIDEALYNYYIRNTLSLTKRFSENRYNEIVENKEFGISMCKKYNIKNVNGYIEEYINNSLNFIQDIFKSNLSNEKRKYKVLQILNDDNFHKCLLSSSQPSIYCKMLKICCLSKRYKLVETIINIKLKLMNYKNKGEVYEN